MDGHEVFNQAYVKDCLLILVYNEGQTFSKKVTRVLLTMAKLILQLFETNRRQKCRNSFDFFYCWSPRAAEKIQLLLLKRHGGRGYMQNSV